MPEGVVCYGRPYSVSAEPYLLRISFYIVDNHITIESLCLLQSLPGVPVYVSKSFVVVRAECLFRY